MQHYHFNKQLLTFEKAKRYNIPLAIFVLVSMLLIGFSSAVKINTVIEKIPVVVRVNEEACTLENVRREIDCLNLPFKEVVLRQVIHESAGLTSHICKLNNNITGMKFGYLRVTTAVGEQFGHAKYNSWRDCLIDYGLWYSSYARQIRTEEEYYLFLDSVYAEDTLYSQKLKQIKI